MADEICRAMDAGIERAMQYSLAEDKAELIAQIVVNTIQTGHGLEVLKLYYKLLAMPEPDHGWNAQDEPSMLVRALTQQSP